MRASDNDGAILENAFVPDDHALAIVGGFNRATKVARGTWVGNQVAIAGIYVGNARHAYEYALDRTMNMKFGDTGAAIATSPMHQVLIGNAALKAEEAHVWLRRQLMLETCEPPLHDNAYTGRNWRLAKGAMCELGMDVALLALKMCLALPRPHGQRDWPLPARRVHGSGPGVPGGARQARRRQADHQRPGLGRAHHAQEVSQGPPPAPEPAAADSSVAANLALFHGVWLDRVVAYHPDGTAMDHDEGGTAAGPFPYQQLVYLDFDGTRLTQTNLPVRGRPPVPRTFRATVVHGVLRPTGGAARARHDRRCRRTRRAGAAPSGAGGHPGAPHVRGPRLRAAPRGRPAHPDHHALP